MFSAFYIVPYVLFLNFSTLLLYKIGLRTEKERWFLLHSLVNMTVMLLVLPDFYDILQNPLPEHPIRPIFNQGVYLTLALHIHHMIHPDYKLVRLDWIHHSLMTSLLFLASLNSSHIKIANCFLLFTNGLPGGIDYFLMFLVKRGFIPKISEKKWNSVLNLYIRSPGTLYCLFVVYLNYIYETFDNLILTLICLGLMFWNAQYFTGVVIESLGFNKAIEQSYPVNFDLSIVNQTDSTFYFDSFTPMTRGKWQIKPQKIKPNQVFFINDRSPLNQNVVADVNFKDSQGNDLTLVVLNWNQKHYGSCVFSISEGNTKYKSSILERQKYSLNPQLPSYSWVQVAFQKK